MNYENDHENLDNQKGNYAIYIDEKIRFFKITTWEKYGKPKRIYVKEIIGGGEADSHPKTIPILNATFRQKVLMEISNDKEAGMRYANEMVRCYRCGRHLTDALSKEKGLGPTCRGY
jgi:hypothetical protein